MDVCGDPSLVLAPVGIAGGAVYDALVGPAEQAAGVVLITRDARAIPTYTAVGATIEIAGWDPALGEQADAPSIGSHAERRPDRGLHECRAELGMVGLSGATGAPCQTTAAIAGHRPVGVRGGAGTSIGPKQLANLMKTLPRSSKLISCEP